ncbi:MAG TPA: sulfatase [Thermomicrobiales bacterium]|nr:sulfatase [Thermomicrobiales bacterium]
MSDAASMKPQDRPNIIYFHSHDTGRYIRPYGHALDTPNYQRLAEQGLLFRQAYTTAPTCSPSRAGLLTGQSPHSAGMLGLAHRGFRLTDPTQHLATTLRDAGYRTTLAGVQHVTTGDPTELGYQQVYPSKQVDADGIAHNAVETIRQHAADPGTQPFFLDIGFFETHRPFPEADPEASRYVQPPAPLPDTPETRQDMADYNVSARRLDRALGDVLDALDETGLADFTLVIATTDHGIAFPRMKCNLTHHGTGVLLIMRGPAPFPSGVVTDALVSQVDIYPTICELLDIERPSWLQGTSLLPVVRNTATEVNDHVFSEVTFHAAYEPQRSVRSKRWTYVERFGGRRLPVLPNCDDSASRDLLLESGWDQQEVDAVQLYDNLFDPGHNRNLAGIPVYADVERELHDRLHAWMVATDDPLRHGDVPLPPGATVNNPDSRSFLEDLIVADDDGNLRTIPNPRTLR